MFTILSMGCDEHFQDLLEVIIGDLHICDFIKSQSPDDAIRLFDLYKKRIDIVLVDISQPQKINDAFEHIKKQAKNIEFSKYIAIIVFGFEKEFPSQKDLEGIGCTAIIPKSISKIERRDDLQSLMKMVKK